MTKMINKNGLYSLLFISFFLIFINFLPINVETQPVLSLFFSVILIVGFSRFSDFQKRDVRFVILLSIVLIIYTCIQLLFDSDYQAIVELFKYLLGPIIFLSLRTNNFSISFSLLKKVVAGIAIIAAVSFILPELYLFLFKFLIPRLAKNIGDIKGIFVLSPEPSYFSAFQIILLITIEKALSQMENGKKVMYTRKQLLYLKYIILFVSILTKS
ncbi:MAG: hypothetical protein V4549_01165, partial [Bacteroidota bacterium]